MSLFSYKCLLGHQFDLIYPLGEAPARVEDKCPQCANAATRTLTTPSVHFHGQGFSRTSAQ